MVYGFARQSGGQVRIYSELEIGTTVTLYLPGHVGDDVEAAAQSMPREMPRSRDGETVLIVDDEPSVRTLIEEVLDTLGYVSLQSEDGASGFRILQSKQHIDLLITDIGLPGKMNGRELANAGLALRPNLKTLFITGYAQNVVVGNDYPSRSINILTKPFRMDALATRIKAIISEPARQSN